MRSTLPRYCLFKTKTFEPQINRRVETPTFSDVPALLLLPALKSLVHAFRRPFRASALRSAMANGFAYFLVLHSALVDRMSADRIVVQSNNRGPIPWLAGCGKT